MSDEYKETSGLKGSLVNPSSPQNNDQLDGRTGDYPSANNTTSSDEYSSATNVRVWSDKAQRGPSNNDNGLIDQSVSGTSLTGEMEDAKQGQDESARERFQRRIKRDFGGDKGQNPYGADSAESKEEAEEMLT